tara:strand:- start:1508 stop:1801 length:294 start_codon:yes stop_codon:yes gene_type:complete
MANQYNVISSSASTSYTGSIAKAQAIGDTVGTSSLARIEFGDTRETPMNPKSHADYTPRSVISKSVIIPSGQYIEGPISALKTGDDGGNGWLIYTID